MGWFRIDDRSTDHPKFLALSDGAFRLWVEGGVFCNRHLTDGMILRVALRGFRYVTRKRIDELCEGALWDEMADGFMMHDYLDWNDSKETVLSKKMLASHRRAFQEDKGLREALRARDKDRCRYCGRSVNWADRKGAAGATYDHINPKGPATLANLVIACRGCNSSKRDRTPEQAGLVLRSVPDLDPNLDFIRDPITDPTSGVVNPLFEERKEEKKDDDRFSIFWESYPRHVGKPAAFKAFKRVNPTGPVLEAMLVAIAQQKHTPQWTKDGGEFIPYPATWLNQRRWEDPIAPRPTIALAARPEWVCPHTPSCNARGACIQRQQMDEFRARESA